MVAIHFKQSIWDSRTLDDYCVKETAKGEEQTFCAAMKRVSSSRHSQLRLQVLAEKASSSITITNKTLLFNLGFCNNHQVR